MSIDNSYLLQQYENGKFEEKEFIYENGITDYVKEISGEISLTSIQHWTAEKIGKDREDNARRGVYHTNFRISAERETLTLSDSQGRVVDRVMIDNLPADCSWGRNEYGQLTVFQSPTPTFSNDQAGAAQMDVQLRAMNRSGVWISASPSVFSSFLIIPYLQSLEISTPNSPLLSF